MNKKEFNWAILGTGVVANEMANALKKAGKSIYAVGNRTHSKAVDFAEKYGVQKVYDDFHEMFSDKNVDIKTLCLRRYLMVNIYFAKNQSH